MNSRPAFRVPSEHLELVWHWNYYDYPLDGLCRINGTLMRFKRHYGARKYRVYQLTPAQKFRVLLHKTLFELCVGKHCSYPDRMNGVRFSAKNPAWLYERLFAFFYRFERRFPLALGRD